MRPPEDMADSPPPTRKRTSPEGASTSPVGLSSKAPTKSPETKLQEQLQSTASKRSISQAFLADAPERASKRRSLDTSKSPSKTHKSPSPAANPAGQELQTQPNTSESQVQQNDKVQDTDKRPSLQPTGSKRSASQAFPSDAPDRAGKWPSLDTSNSSASAQQSDHPEVNSVKPVSKDPNSYPNIPPILVFVLLRDCKDLTRTIRVQNKQIEALKLEVEKYKKPAKLLKTFEKEYDRMKERLKVANERTFAATQGKSNVKYTVELYKTWGDDEPQRFLKAHFGVGGGGEFYRPRDEYCSSDEAETPDDQPSATANESAQETSVSQQAEGEGKAPDCLYNLVPLELTEKDSSTDESETSAWQPSATADTSAQQPVIRYSKCDSDTSSEQSSATADESAQEPSTPQQPKDKGKAPDRPYTLAPLKPAEKVCPSDESGASAEQPSTVEHASAQETSTPQQTKGKGKEVDRPNTLALDTADASTQKAFTPQQPKDQNKDIGKAPEGPHTLSPKPKQNELQDTDTDTTVMFKDFAPQREAPSQGQPLAVPVEGTGTGTGTRTGMSEDKGGPGEEPTVPSTSTSSCVAPAIEWTFGPSCGSPQQQKKDDQHDKEQDRD